MLASPLDKRSVDALLITGCLLLLTACGADRFEQTGCTSNDDCRAERVCQESRCVDADTLSTEDYEGTWEMELSGTITTEEDGEQSFDDELEIPVEEGDETDLVVELPADDDACQLGANLVSGGFEFDDEGCTVVQDGEEMTFRDVEGAGRLEGDELFFEFEAEVDVEPEDGEPYTADYEASVEGPRAD